ncbi:MAG: hypothetical protein ABL908_06400, partial [Hyphomicrobium sp.]
MALIFPASPTDGQLHVAGNDVTYFYSAARGLWAVKTGSGGGGSSPGLNTVGSPEIADGSVVAADLATTGVAAATYGSATNIPQITINTKGQVTSAINVPIAAGATVVDNLTTTSATSALSAGQGVVLTAADIASGAVVGSNLVLTKNAGGTVTIDVTNLLADVKLQSGTYNAGTQALDLLLSNGSTVSVPVAQLLPVQSEMSVTGDGMTATKVKLVNDSAAPGNNMVYGTTAAGVKGWKADPAGVTVVDNLTTSSATSALSANQGVVLTGNDIASGAVAGNILTLTKNNGGTIPAITLPAGTALGTAAPVMNGVAAAGAATAASKEDHIHPSDTSRVAVVDIDNTLTQAAAGKVLDARQGAVLTAADIASGTVAGNVLTLTKNGGGTIAIDVTTLANVADLRLQSGAYNAGTQNIDFTMSDASIISVPVASLLPVSAEMSVSGTGTAADKLKLVNDSAAPGNLKVYGTDAAGVKGWKADPAAPAVMIGSGATAAAGLAPQPPAVAGTRLFLREDATYAEPAIMLGSGPTAKAGFAPQPPAVAGSSLFLREDATYAAPAAFLGSGPTAKAGFVPTPPAAAGSSLFLREDATFGATTATFEHIAQAAHGFVVKDAVYHTGAAWAKAQADTGTKPAIGIITKVIDAANFVVTYSGRAEMLGHGLTPGEYYWLSQATAGALTAVAPASGYAQSLLHVRDINNVVIDCQQIALITAGVPLAPGLFQNLPNFAADAAFVAASIDSFDGVRVAQTTAGRNIGIPSPSNPANYKAWTVFNDGTTVLKVNFTGEALINPKSSQQFVWYAGATRWEYGNSSGPRFARFTTNDSFVAPTDLIYVTGCGGGGGGGAGGSGVWPNCTSGCGGGGGGAAGSVRVPISVVRGTIYPISIGGGGAGGTGNFAAFNASGVNGNNGVAGGTSSIGALWTAPGGGGGEAGGGSQSGAGGGGQGGGGGGG